jgi:predicted GNAT family acetyltransferase
LNRRGEPVQQGETHIGHGDIIIHHEPKAQRFAVRLNNHIAYLSYEEREDGVLDYAHVYVPPEYRNRGIASKLTRRALEYARKVGITVIPSCSFVEYYLTMHPEFEDIVTRTG